MSNFQEYFTDIFKYKYADFNGRARRSEYWYFVLFTLLIAMLFVGVIVLGAVMEIGFIAITGGILLGIFWLGIIIPQLAAGSRRLHDTNKSGWLQLITLIPFGNIILIVFFCLEGDQGSNQYGPNPKEPNSESTSDHLVDF